MKRVSLAQHGAEAGSGGSLCGFTQRAAGRQPVPFLTHYLGHREGGLQGKRIIVMGVLVTNTKLLLLQLTNQQTTHHY